MHTLLAQWIPPEERGRVATFIWAGTPVGNILAMLISGIIASEINWQTVFYFCGALGLINAILWTFLVFESPATHPRISKVLQLVECVWKSQRRLISGWVDFYQWKDSLSLQGQIFAISTSEKVSDFDSCVGPDINSHGPILGIFNALDPNSILLEQHSAFFFEGG